MVKVARQRYAKPGGDRFPPPAHGIASISGNTWSLMLKIEYDVPGNLLRKVAQSYYYGAIFHLIPEDLGVGGPAHHRIVGAGSPRNKLCHRRIFRANHARSAPVSPRAQFPMGSASITTAKHAECPVTTCVFSEFRTAFSILLDLKKKSSPPSLKGKMSFLNVSYHLRRFATLSHAKRSCACMFPNIAFCSEVPNS